MNNLYNESFIRVYDKVIPTDTCQGIIKYFDWCQLNNKTFGRSESSSNYKKDQSTNLSPQNFWEINFASAHLQGYLKEFNQIFWDNCYKNYCSEFDTLNSYSRHTIYTYKVQKTLPRGGYHVWHCENGVMEFSRRIGVYILYLNDVPEGGETEFLYQSVRVPPTEGTLVIFPSAFTHTHRGNPPLRGEKYIMTGWIEFS